MFARKVCTCVGDASTLLPVQYSGREDGYIEISLPGLETQAFTMLKWILLRERARA
jgi:hypothetical protein